MINRCLISICIALGLAGCNNVMIPAEYNKAEELCKNANQSVVQVAVDPLAIKESIHRIKVLCSNGIIISSSVK